MRHLVTLDDLSPDELRSIIHLSREIKLNFLKGKRDPVLAGHTMALLFEKPSLRTRISFETLINHMGGASLYLDQSVGWGHREPLHDFVPILSSYVDLIVARTMKHQTVLDIVEHSRCSVINGLTDLCHPCQAIADLLTAFEHFGSFDFVKFAFVGDANNVSRSLAIGCAKLELDFTLVCPKAYQFDAEFIDRLDQATDANIRQTDDLDGSVSDATVIYTDVWASMGQESENEQRRQDFQPYQVNSGLMEKAHHDAIFMHCLPARRGEEVTAEVIDGPQSKIILEAENRLHAQKGLVYWLTDL